MVANSSKIFLIQENICNNLNPFKDMNESEESTSQHQIPLKIEWPSRKILGLEEDDSDERADSGVGESVSMSRTSVVN